MALIECVECGRSISDQAGSCPGCGYPLGEAVNSRKGGASPSDESCIAADSVTNSALMSRYPDLPNLSKEEIWFKAYTLHYTGHESDIPDIVNLYKFIISKFEYTQEFENAKKQLGKITAKYGNIDTSTVERLSSKKEISNKMADLHEYERYRLAVGGGENIPKDISVAKPSNSVLKVIGGFVLILILWVAWILYSSQSKTLGSYGGDFSAMEADGRAKADTIMILIRTILILAGAAFGITVARLFQKK